MTSSKHPTGGCACDQFRYSAEAEPGFSFLCQCTICQKSTGTGHAAAFIIPADKFKSKGELNWYDTTAESGNVVSHGFCAICGTPVMNKNSGHKELVFVTAGTLDNPDLFTPTKVLYRDTARPWDLADPQAED